MVAERGLPKPCPSIARAQVSMAGFNGIHNGPMHDGGLGGDTTQPEVREAWYAMTPDRLYEFCRHQTDFMNFVNDTRQIFMFFFLRFRLRRDRMAGESQRDETSL